MLWFYSTLSTWHLKQGGGKVLNRKSSKYLFGFGIHYAKISPRSKNCELQLIFILLWLCPAFDLLPGYGWNLWDLTRYYLCVAGAVLLRQAMLLLVSDRRTNSCCTVPAGKDT